MEDRKREIVLYTTPELKKTLRNNLPFPTLSMPAFACLCPCICPYPCTCPCPFSYISLAGRGDIILALVTLVILLRLEEYVTLCQLQ